MMEGVVVMQTRETWREREREREVDYEMRERFCTKGVKTFHGLESCLFYKNG